MVLVNSIATIEQEIMLFAGSVRDNLTLWDTNIQDSNSCKSLYYKELGN
jgi:ABC-type bacteriocin/lantibiotic exporter with double-glycine peptidase domain